MRSVITIWALPAIKIVLIFDLQTAVGCTYCGAPISVLCVHLRYAQSAILMECQRAVTASVSVLLCICFPATKWAIIECTSGKEHEFTAVSRVDENTLRAQLEKVETVLESSLPLLPDKPSSMDTAEFSLNAWIAQAAFPWRRPPLLRPTEEELFRALWERNIPIVVDQVSTYGDWTPEGLSELYGDVDVKVFDSRKSKPVNMRLQDFLQELISLSTEPAAKYTLRLAVCIIFYNQCLNLTLLF